MLRGIRETREDVFYASKANFYNSIPDKEKAHTTKAVVSLSDYWHLKGLFMKARRNPVYAMKNNHFHECLFNFLKHHTNINEFKFWSRLSDDEKRLTCKYFTLQENNINNNLSTNMVLVIV